MTWFTQLVSPMTPKERKRSIAYLVLNALDQGRLVPEVYSNRMVVTSISCRYLRWLTREPCQVNIFGALIYGGLLQGYKDLRNLTERVELIPYVPSCGHTPRRYFANKQLLHQAATLLGFPGVELARMELATAGVTWMPISPGDMTYPLRFRAYYNNESYTTFRAVWENILEYGNFEPSEY